MSVLDQARAAWHSGSCPACGSLKNGARHFFCRECWKKLPGEITANLWRVHYGTVGAWVKAMEFLKPLHGAEEKANG